MHFSNSDQQLLAFWAAAGLSLCLFLFVDPTALVHIFLRQSNVNASAGCFTFTAMGLQNHAKRCHKMEKNSTEAKYFFAYLCTEVSLRINNSVEDWSFAQSFF